MNPALTELPLLLSACTAALPLLVLCAAAPAQQPADADARAFLARIDAARGKLPAALAVEGTFAVTMGPENEPVAKGTFREIYVGGDQARQICAMGAFGSMERVVTKDLAWEIDPSFGAKVNAGAQGVTARRLFAVLRGASPSSLYRDVARTGMQKLDGKDVVVLKMTPAQGKAETWYVDAETGLPSRVDMMLPAPESTVVTFGMDDWQEAQIGFADWQKVGDSMQPGRRTMKMGPATVSYTCQKFDPAAKPEASTFTPPAAVLKLKDAPQPRVTDEEGKPVFQLVDREAQPVASIRVKCKPSEISATLATILPEVGAHLTAVGAKMAGPPFSRYHSVSDTEIDLEGGVPVAKPITGKGRVQAGELPAGKCAMVWHIGPYEKLRPAHEGLRAWVDRQKLKVRGAPWEIYWTDPGMVPDPAKWRTQLFLPVEK